MPASRVVDQEFVVHLFAPLDGPQAADAYRQIQRVWVACREQLGMTEPIAEIRAPILPPETIDGLTADGLVAAQESRADIRQAVLRRVHDVLNLSVALAQPAPEELRSSRRRLPAGQLRRPPPQRRLGWVEFAQMWANASMPAAGAWLGEARLFLAKTPRGNTGAVAAAAELGRSLDPLLPYREDRPRQWWQGGTTTAAGYALWDAGLAADTSDIREIVLIAAADRDAELSAWTWSDGTPQIPPFARYLLHAAKLRYEARLMDAWHRDSRAPGDPGGMPADRDATAPPGARAELVRAELSRLSAEQRRLADLEADLRNLRQTVTIAHDNLRSAAAGVIGDNSAGMFAADQALANWLLLQAGDDISYLEIDMNRITRARTLAADDLAQLERAGCSGDSHAVGDPGQLAPATQLQDAAGASGADEIARRVFIVHGRDGILVSRFRDLLRAVDLQPLEWETLVGFTGSTAPYIGEVVARAPHQAQATLVLLTPDDVVELHPDLVQDNDLPYEQGLSAQARPNVLFELGLALMAYPDRTIVVEVGQTRPIGDLAGLNRIRFDGSPAAIKKVVDRLKLARCSVNDSGTDWLDLARFAGMAAYRRGPGTHRGDR